MTASAVPFVFSPNTLIQSAQVNADFTSLVGSLNNIDAAQITTGVLPVSNGGTGVTTPGAITTSIGAVAKAGDTMTGTLTVPNIAYSGGTGTYAFSWDGTNTHVIVNGVDTSIIGDVTAITAGNGLTGGGAGGAVTLAMSGSYSGDFTVSGITSTGSLGVFGSVQVNGNINSNVNITGAYISSSGNVNAAGSLIAPNISSNSGTVHTPSQWAYDNHVYDGTHGFHYNGLVAFSWAAVYAFSYPGASDRRLKTAIQDLPNNCAALVEAISPRRFKWREGVTILDHTRTHWGFVAQEVGAVFGAENLDFGGHQIGDDEQRSETLDATEMVAVLWKAVQELTAKVAALEAARAAP